MFVICWKEKSQKITGNNTTFGCLSQIIANKFIPESVVMGTLIGEMGALKHSFKKAYQHYHEEIIKNEYFDTLDDE